MAHQKFNRPKGIGFLYIKKGIAMLPYMEGGVQEFSMRAGTENIASIVGMATALTKNVAAIDDNREHLGILEQIILQRLYVTGVDLFEMVQNHMFRATLACLLNGLKEKCFYIGWI